ncbi:hypothetical protein PMAYCL1PPCAC_28489, partial [Pristionchus mayeri]
MFTPVPSSPVSSRLSTSPSLPSPTAQYTNYPTTPTEHDISALTPSFAQSLAISTRTTDECSVYSNSSVPPPTPMHTLRDFADQLEGRSDHILSEAIRLLREAEIGQSLADRLREMAGKVDATID